MTPAETAQRRLAIAHHSGGLSGGAYAFGCNIVEQLTYFAKPECVAEAYGPWLATSVLELCRDLDRVWQASLGEKEQESGDG